MKKILISLMIVSSLVYGWGHASVKGCVVYINDKVSKADIYVPIKGTSFRYYKSIGVVSIDGNKMDSKNHKILLKAWKKCNK